MTIQKLTQSVIQRLKEGWKWESITPEIECLLPPQGDERRDWDLDWVPFDNSGRIARVVPQWTDAEHEGLYNK